MKFGFVNSLMCRNVPIQEFLLNKNKGKLDEV